MDEFTSAAIVVAYTAFDSNVNATTTAVCDAMLKISFELILKRSASRAFNYENFVSKLVRDNFNKNVRFFREELEIVYKIILPSIILPEYQINWPYVIGPYVWVWIHIVTQYIDLNGGINEKESFINFLENLILCTTCRTHYQENKPMLLRSLVAFSLTDIFLILHTCIQENIRFRPDKTKIQHKFKTKFFDYFLNCYNSVFIE